MYNSGSILVFSVAAFFTLFLLCIGIWQIVYINAQRRKIIQKIKRNNQDFNSSPTRPDVSEVKTSKLLNIFSLLGRKLLKRKTATSEALEYSRMRLRFLKAGIRYAKAAEIYWGVRCWLLVIMPTLFLVMRFTIFKVTNSIAVFAITALVAMIGYYIPDLWLRFKISIRKEKLLKALPDALDLLVVCVEAGVGLDSAFSRVANEIHLSCPELSSELKLMGFELRAGKSRQAALRNLATRSDLDEISSLATLLIQTDKFGTSMAASLRVFSEAYRTQRYQRAEEKAAKMPVKMIFPLILFIFPSLFAVILGPAVIRIWENIIK